MSQPTPTRRVLIVDQFYWISPYALSQEPMQFDDLLREVEAYEKETPSYWRPQVLDVPEDYRPRWAQTVFAADADGRAFCWKSNWDSSG